MEQAWFMYITPLKVLSATFLYLGYLKVIQNYEKCFLFFLWTTEAFAFFSYTKNMLSEKSKFVLLMPKFVLENKFC